MNVYDRQDTYVGQVYPNGDVHNHSGYIGRVYANGDVHDRNGYVGRVYANGDIHSSTYEGHIYNEGSVNDRNDRPAGKVSGIGMFSRSEGRYFAGGAALLLLLQPTASSASTPTSGSKEVFSTLGGRTVWKYTVNNAAEKMGAEEGIVGLEEWAVVKDVGVVFPPRTSWEIWVAGELKDTVFSESDAKKELRKYLSEDTVRQPQQQGVVDRGRTTIPMDKPQVPLRGQKNGSFSRRKVIGGLAGLLGLAATGGGAWWLVSPHPLTYRGHSGWVFAVSWSPDGTRLASGSEDKTVQVWRAADGGEVFTYHGHSDVVIELAWSPHSQRLASASLDKTVQVWNAADGSHTFTYHGHSDAVYSVSWSPDGTYLASAGADKTVQVWNAADASHIYTYRGHSDVVTALAWSPHSQRLASASADKTVQVWNAADGSRVYAYRGHSDGVMSVAWSPDGRYIASGDYAVQVWNAADGGLVYTYNGRPSSFYAVEALAWSPDGTRLAAGGSSSTVQVWNAADGSHIYTYRGHADFYFGHFTSDKTVSSITWSPDSKLLASGSYDETVQVWQVP